MSEHHRDGARRPSHRRSRSLEGREHLYSEKTHLIHGHFQSTRWDYRHHVVPPQSSSVTYRLDSSQRAAEGFHAFAEGHVAGQPPIYIYDRLDEPTRGMLEENLAYAEGGEIAVCFASGMAAISAAVSVLLRAGQRLVAHPVLYGCTYSLFRNWLPRFGVEATFVDCNDPAALQSALTDDVRVVYFETPVNPDLTLVDIARVRALVDGANARRRPEDRIFIVVDNTFCTPYGQRPLSLGADVVVASLTKNIGGFGTDLGGVVVGPRFLEGALLGFRKDFGAVLSPRSAWPFLVYGLPTLPVRFRQQQQTALRVARFLEADPRVQRVRYPGLESFPQRELAQRQMVDYEGHFAPGTLVYFELAPDPSGRAAERLMDYIAEHAYAITLAVSLGQIKTLIEHPYSMTHSALTGEGSTQHLVHPGGVRLSIGLEKGEDLIRDLKEALDAVLSPRALTS
jgi:cystathionine beta-lyase/cystathionine gamma-synthase